MGRGYIGTGRSPSLDRMADLVQTGRGELNVVRILFAERTGTDTVKGSDFADLKGRQTLA